MLGIISSMLNGRKITATLTEETLEGSVPKGGQQRGILSPLLCYLTVNKFIQGLDGNGCYRLGIYPQKVRQLDQHFMKPGH